MTMEAYCFNCRAKREMRDLKATFFSNGSPATEGYCTTCGNKIFRMGRTEAHVSLVPPVVVRKPRAAKAGGAKKNTTKSRTTTTTMGTAEKGSPRETTKASNQNEVRRSGAPLVIVESPTKARTIGKFLGRKFNVRPSVGHIRDLPKNRLGVDLEHDFAPTYVVPMAKKKTVKELQIIARDATEIWLATDPDREGEAISWHLQHALSKEIAGKTVHRVEFHEITPHAIEEAFKHPRAVDVNLVNSQQARRILDRLVGYTLSPLLRDKLGRKGLSAGRVQSVALRLVCEREREVAAFVPVEYWSIEAELAKLPGADDADAAHHHRLAHVKPQPSFIAKLHKLRGQDPDLKNEADSQGIVTALTGAAYRVWKVDRKERQRKPAAPFTTSTLQQEASRKLGFNARRTMSAAQQLYEGMDVGEGTIGLITYMRTDSVNVATSAQAEARAFISEKYGAPFIPPEPPRYITRAKNAQEAHEAIRPTSVFRTPESVRQYLDKDQLRTYDLIWKRFVASQMENAVFDVTVVDVEAAVRSAANPVADGAAVSVTTQPDYLFRASGSIIKFAGFLKVYEEGHDEGDATADDAQDKRLPELAQNEPLDLKRLLPEQHFTQPPPRYTEASLIRRLEEEGIGRPSTYASIMTVIQSRDYVYREGKQLRPSELGFQVNDMLVGNFARYIDVGFTAHVEEDLDRIETAQREWVPVLHEFFDPFREAVRVAGVNIVPIERKIELVGQKCPTCGEGDLIYRQSRFGKFIGCSRFPRCRHTGQIGLPGVCCPKDGGELVEKRMKKGKRLFYGCANYPACDFTTWNKPLAGVSCPTGDGGLMVEAGKGRAKCLICGTMIDLPETSE